MILVHLSVAIAANWAVLVSTSSSWYDYRHTSNVLAIGERLQAMGIAREHIILMTAGQHRNDPRNIYGEQRISEYTALAGTPDYSGQRVNVHQLHQVLMNRGTKTLDSDSTSNVFVYLTGHGAEGALGFDGGPLTALHLDTILNEMWVAGRYRNLMLMVDSCQSETMIDGITAPGVVAVASARRGRPSYSEPRETAMGISLIDKFSHATAQALNLHASLESLAAAYRHAQVEACVRGRLPIAFSEFFSGSAAVLT